MSLISLEFAPKYGPLTSETTLREANIVATRLSDTYKDYRCLPTYVDIYRALRVPCYPDGSKRQFRIEMICS